MRLALLPQLTLHLPTPGARLFELPRTLIKLPAELRVLLLQQRLLPRDVLELRGQGVDGRCRWGRGRGMGADLGAQPRGLRLDLLLIVLEALLWRPGGLLGGQGLALLSTMLLLSLLHLRRLLLLCPHHSLGLAGGFSCCLPGLPHSPRLRRCRLPCLRGCCSSSTSSSSSSRRCFAVHLCGAFGLRWRGLRPTGLLMDCREGGGHRLALGWGSWLMRELSVDMI